MTIGRQLDIYLELQLRRLLTESLSKTINMSSFKTRWVASGFLATEIQERETWVEIKRRYSDTLRSFVKNMQLSWRERSRRPPTNGFADDDAYHRKEQNDPCRSKNDSNDFLGSNFAGVLRPNYLHVWRIYLGTTGCGWCSIPLCVLSQRCGKHK